MLSRTPHPRASIDKHVSQRLKMARRIANLSQDAVGKHLGLTFQQIQKYEKGTNRVGAGTLMTLAKLYKQPITFFYEGLSDDPVKAAGNDLAAVFFSAAHAADLARAFLAIESADARQAVVHVAQAIVEARDA